MDGTNSTTIPPQLALSVAGLCVPLDGRLGELFGICANGASGYARDRPEQRFAGRLSIGPDENHLSRRPRGGAIEPACEERNVVGQSLRENRFGGCWSEG